MLFVILFITIMFIPHTDTVAFSQVEDSTLEGVQIEGYSGNMYNQNIRVRSNNYDDIYRVSILNKNDEIIDSELFNKGNKASNFNIGNYITTKRPSSLKIVSVNRKGKIINQGKINIKYNEKEIEQGLIYRYYW